MDEAKGRKLDRLAALICSSPHNLVSARDREQVRRVHIDEAAIVGARLVELGVLRAGAAWIDIGTGGGLPGLVLALLYPDVSWTLLDATRKKAEAVRSFATALELDNTAVLHGRAEELAHEGALRGRFDGAITRAVAPLPVVIELSRGFVRPGGAITAVKGPRWREEAPAARSAARACRVGRVHGHAVDGTARPTCLVTMTADGAAPAGIPRRTGLPRSRPLGGSGS